MRSTITALCILVLCIWLPPARSEDYPARLEKPLDTSITIRQKTQKDRDRWADQRRRLEAELKQLAAERDRLKDRGDQLQQRADSLQAAVDHLNNQLAAMSRITAELIPFLEETYSRLADFIAEDTPFLAAERKDRLRLLRRTLDDPLVSTGEKYRKIMEALFIEAEYGNTVEIYRDKIDLNGTKILADLFRLGRISLFFRTLDRQTVGHWDPAKEVWTALPDNFTRPIHAAMEMAAKRRSVDLVNLPLGRITAP